MNITFINSGKHLTEQDIAEFEKVYEVRLPEDYKSLLLQVNGGRPEMNYFPFEEDGFMVTWLYCLKEGKHTLEDTLEMLWIAESVIPRTLLPIATGPGAEFICLNLDEETFGGVTVWFGNKEEEPVRLATSFTEFLNQLTTRQG